MKIYLIGQKGIPAIHGGVERHVEELATRLAKQGNEVFVYARKHYTPAELKEFKGVKIIHVPSIKTKHLDAITHTLFASLDVLRRDADIIHYHAIGPSSLLWIPKLLKRKAKVISTFHCDDRQHQKWSWFARKCLGLGAFVSVRFADRTIAVSKNMSHVHGQEFKGELDYIPNGVPVLEKVAPEVITENWALKGNDYIVAISRLIKHKGLHHLIRAYSAVKTDKKLVIVGDANYTDDYVKHLKTLAGDNPNIVFTGNQTGRALAELYSNAYLYVHPSEAEGLSIGLLEAMSYGKAVLCSDIGPNKEVVEDLAMTFKNKSINDLKEKLEYLLANPGAVENMIPGLKERVATEYDWDNITKRTIELYKIAAGEATAEQENLVKAMQTKSLFR